jgi:hypothetical protein
MKGWHRVVTALVGGATWTAALWYTTGPGVPVPDRLRTLFVWLLFPGWLVAPWDRYQLALVADALLYALVLWLLLALANRLKRRSPPATEPTVPTR